MAEVTSVQSEPHAPSESDDKIGRFLSVGILSRFMRITYGTQAAAETQRRITAYTKATNHDLAKIWQRVLVRLTGYDPGANTRLVVRAKRSLKVKT